MTIALKWGTKMTVNHVLQKFTFATLLSVSSFSGFFSSLTRVWYLSRSSMIAESCDRKAISSERAQNICMHSGVSKWGEENDQKVLENRKWHVKWSKYRNKVMKPRDNLQTASNNLYYKVFSDTEKRIESRYTILVDLHHSQFINIRQSRKR